MYPTISVIIPNFNRGALLEKAIRSVLEQTVPVAEILVCDDGSTDDAKHRVAQLQMDYPQVVWLDCGSNGRPAIPRNQGISRAQGEWIAFLDNDDTWEKTKLEEQLRIADAYNVHFICTNAWRVSDNEKASSALIHHSTGKYQFSDLIAENFIVCSSVLVHHSLLKQSQKFPEHKYFKAIEDYALWLEIGLNAPIFFLQTPLVNYLDLPQQSIRSGQDNEYAMYRRILLRTLRIAVNKHKFSKAMICIAQLLRNTFYEFRYNYRMRKSGGNA